MNNEKNDEYKEALWASAGIVREPPHWGPHLFIMLVALSMIAIVGYSVLTSFPVAVESQGELTTLRPPVPIKAAVKFTVSEILVTENKMVKTGDILLKSSEDISDVNQQLLASYVAKIQSAIKILKKPDCEQCLARFNEAIQIYMGLQLQGDLILVVSPVQDRLQQLISGMENYKIVINTIKDSELQVKVSKQKLEKIQRKGAGKLLAKEVEELNTIIAQSQRRITEKLQESTQRISDSSTQLSAVLSDLRNKIDYLGSVLTVRAPFDGIVNNIKVKGAGEFVEPGKILMELIPGKTELIAQIKVLNKDVALVKPGQQVVISVDALPELEYGTIEGTVETITRFESADRADRASSDSIFLVAVKLANQNIKKSGEIHNLIIGMTIKARIVSKYEPLYKHAIRQIFHLKDSQVAL